MAVAPRAVPELFAELGKLINLPPRVVALDLRLRVNEVPSVTVTYHPRVDSAAEITRHFDLVEASSKE